MRPDGQRDVDIATDRVRVRTELAPVRNHLFCGRLVDGGDANVESHRQQKPPLPKGRLSRSLLHRRRGSSTLGCEPSWMTALPKHAAQPAAKSFSGFVASPRPPRLLGKDNGK
jgi:hypothetical protein